MKPKNIISLILSALILASTLSPAVFAAEDAVSPDGLFADVGQEALAFEKQDFTYYEPEAFSAADTAILALVIDAANSNAVFNFDGDYPAPSVSPVPLKKAGHGNYMNGYSDGRFDPDGGLTRAEAAQLLCNLLPETAPFETLYTDVYKSAWYYKAVTTLAGLGVIGGDGAFHPNWQITRAEFVAMLGHLEPESERADVSEAPAFHDVNDTHWAYAYIRSAVARGQISGFADGTFRPDAGLTRAEAATLMNRVLGRRPDKAVIDANPEARIFLENLKKHWAYYEIMEATVPHEESVSDGAETWEIFESIGFSGDTGFYYYQNHLRYYDAASGVFVKNAQIGGFSFDGDGYYTSGNAELDGYLYSVAASIFNDGMTREQMLRAAFLYVRDSFAYLRRNAYATGETGWETQDAITMFKTHYGNCYNYAAAFYTLARWLGYDAVTYAGTVGSNNSPHGWVEISFNGVPYIFDTELEMARLRDGRPYFVLYMLPYDSVPWTYRR